ncbi:MAG TPA: hypothetical protein VM328_01065 [Fimbriimonadaceae bacterium]|nr:hypothetical protein [Fimbriimonadaceae bacterium]
MGESILPLATTAIRKEFRMSPQEAAAAAQSILDKRQGEEKILVLVDNPNDATATIRAFRKLGCKVQVQQQGARLVITRGE